jgi:hypothetical protein
VAADEPRRLTTGEDARKGRLRAGVELDWALDLTSREPSRRARALARYQQTERRYWEAQRRINELWAQAGTIHPADPRLAAAMDQAITALQDAGQYRFLQAVWDWPGEGRGVELPIRPISLVDATPQVLSELVRHPERADDWGRDSPLLPFVLVLLEWEVAFPQDWPKDWGTKKRLLRELARLGRYYDQDVRRRLADLVMAAVSRPHRCEDQGYGAVARAVADEQLRRRLEQAAGVPDRLTRLRASFLLFLLDHPEVPSRPREWTRWLQQEAG